MHPSLPVSCLNPPYPLHPPVPHMVTNRAVIACLSWVGVEIVENQNMYHNSFIAPWLWDSGQRYPGDYMSVCLCPPILFGSWYPSDLSLICIFIIPRLLVTLILGSLCLWLSEILQLLPKLCWECNILHSTWQL